MNIRMISLTLVSLLGMSLLAQGTQVLPEARFNGNFGVRFDATAATAESSLTRTLSESVTRYRARVYVDASNLSLANGAVNLFSFLEGDTDSANAFSISLFDDAQGVFSIHAITRQDDASTEVGNAAMPDVFSWFAVEVVWTTGDGSGALTVFVDDVALIELTGLDNDTLSMTSESIGNLNGGSSASGTIDMDDFESRKFTKIGLSCISGAENLAFQADFPSRNIKDLVNFVNLACIQLF